VATVCIPLTQGKVAIIDEEDFPLISRYKWRAFKDHNTWYAATGGHRGDETYPFTLMHRLILDSPPNILVDHKDRNGLRNVRENLRSCSVPQNAANHALFSTNTSGYHGVTVDTATQRYKVHVGREYLGYYDDAITASLIHDCVARLLHGEFASLNHPAIAEYPVEAATIRAPRAASDWYRDAVWTIEGNSVTAIKKEPDGSISSEEAAALLGIHRKTLMRKYVKTNLLPAVRKGGDWRLNRDDVLAYDSHRAATGDVIKGDVVPK
jgi:excisionase family DNA binding protein